MNNFFKIVLIILMFFLFSCEKEKLVRDDEAVSDDDAVENDEQSDDDQVPACADEWEHTELIEDVSTMFDFDIKVETGKWNWDQLEEFDELVFEGDPLRVLGVMNDGSLVMAENDNTVEGYSILAILHPDGTTSRYILEIDKGKKITFGIGTIDIFEPFVFWAGHYFDKERQEILISVTMMTKLESPYSEEYSARPFIIKIDASGSLSYIAWENDGTSICTDLTQTDDKIILFCSHWIPDPEIYMKEGRINAEINVITGNSVYRKMMKSEYIALTGISGAGNNNGEIYSFYKESSYTQIEATEFGFIYSFDEKNLCLKAEGPENYFDELAFEGSPYEGYNMMYPFSFIKKGEYSIVGGVRAKLEHLDYEQIQSFNSSLYVDHSDNDTIFSFGIKDPRFEVGEVSGIHPVAEPMIFSKENSNLLFLSLISTFDMEDEGQDWLTPELLEENDFLYRPSIAAVDIETKEAYIRNFFMGDLVGFFGEAKSFGEYIYFLINYGQERALYRMPESWLINENAKAKETRFFIEDIAELREAILKELKPFKTVSSGKNYTCALDEEKRVICWGNNSDYQLGNTVGPTRPYPDLIFMEGILKDKEIEIMETGSNHACVVADDKRIYCWGSDDEGKLGIGFGNFTLYPVSVKYDGVLKDKVIVDVSPGGGHTCAIDVDGKAYCWGRNTLGSAGTETDFQLVYEPVEVDMTGVLKDKKIVEISSGSYHTCSIDEDGGVCCWGSNGRGQLGDGNGGDEGSLTELGDFSLFPVKTETAEGKYIKVSAGNSHTCILNDKGKIYCFGENKNGQLGDGTTEMRLVPVELKSDKVFKSVSAGFEHSCAIDDKDELYCWGGNPVGQLGTGDKESSLTPVKVKYETDSKIKSVSCGHRHTCSVTTEGIVHCWGWNTSGQLGNGTYEDSLLPKEIKTKE